jgi:RNA polymerase sigma-70 factor, ECF subfamily
MSSSPGEITQILARIRAGERGAEERLIPLVYDELRRMAAHYMRLERSGHTLQSTALVHEAYVRLLGEGDIQWENHSHFFGVAAQMMRRILVDYARARKAEKRGGPLPTLSLEEATPLPAVVSPEILALDEALSRLEQRDARQCRIVELLFFGGLSEAEAATVLGISARTVRRDWTVAKAWLYQQVSKPARIVQRR